MLEKIFASVEKSNFVLEQKIFEERTEEAIDRKLQSEPEREHHAGTHGFNADAIQQACSTSEPTSPSSACQCGSCEFYRLKGKREWLCSKCKPEPKLKTLIAEKFLVGDQTHEDLTIFFEKPTCDRCKCSIGVQTFAAGQVRIKCWSCGGPIEDPWSNHER